MHTDCIMTDRDPTCRDKKGESYLHHSLRLSGINDVDMFTLSLLPPALAPMLRTVCSSWASAIPRCGLSPELDDYDYKPEALCLYLAEHGSFDSLKWACACNAPLGDISLLLSALATAGRTDCLAWLLDVSGRIHRLSQNEASDVCLTAATSGALNVLDWAIQREDFGPNAMLSVSLSNSAPAIAWALNHNITCNSWAYVAAAAANDIPLLDSLRRSNVPLPDTSTMGVSGPDFMACQNASFDALRWLLSAGFQFRPDRATRAAAAKGHIHVLDWLLRNSLLDTQATGPCVAAAASGLQHVVHWLHHCNGCPWDARVVTAAGASGNLSLVQWLCSEGCPYDLQKVMNEALSAGRIPVIEWCLHNGASWNAASIDYAVLRGHLDTVRWCRAHGAPWGANPCRIVISGRQDAMLSWLISDEGGAAHFLDPACIASAAQAGSISTLKILFAAHCPFDDSAIERAFYVRRLDIIKLLHKGGCPMMDHSFITKRHLPEHPKIFVILDWLYAHGCPWTTDAYNALVTHRGPEISAWAKKRGPPSDCLLPVDFTPS